MIVEQEYELVGVDRLSPHPDNPRRGNVAALAESVDTNGFYGAIVAQRSTGHVLAGNHRLLAARHHGLDEVPVVWVDVDDDRARRILLVDNRSNDLAGYDDDALAALLGDMPDLAGTGYTAEDLMQLATPSGPGNSVALTDPDQVPEPPAEPYSKPGDCWELGPHRVVCGDATDVRDVKRAVRDAPADVLWTDPPYGVEYVGKTADALTIRNDGAAGLEHLLRQAFNAVDGCLARGAAVYVCHAAGPLSLVVGETIQNAGWDLRQQLIWVKDSMVLGRSDYRHELAYTPVPPDRWYGDDAQTSVFEVDRPKRSKDHPTMKPVALITAMLTNSCPPGGTVLDPFAGSGSTLIAAHTVGRFARLIELDPRYVDVVCRRWQEHAGDTPVNAATGEAHDFVGGA